MSGLKGLPLIVIVSLGTGDRGLRGSEMGVVTCGVVTATPGLVMVGVVLILGVARGIEAGVAGLNDKGLTGVFGVFVGSLAVPGRGVILGVSKRIDIIF